jgi:hypothetical protein
MPGVSAVPTLFGMLRLLTRRLVTRAALTAAVTATMVVGISGTANAAVSGTVRTSSGDNLTVRASPGTSYDAWTSVASGSTVSILCQASGTSVSGYYGTTSTWYMISNGGFVSGAYTRAASTPPNCVYVGAPPRANPRSTNSAISWAFSNYGSTAYEGWCLRFTALSYGWSASGWNTAEIGGDWISSHGYMHTTGTPPRGAIVWYHNSAGTGHAAISIGQGKVVSTSVGGRVAVANYTYHSYYRGWSVPYYPYAG